MKDKVKELRVKIDGLAQLTKELKPIHLDIGGSIVDNPDKIELGKLNSDQISKATDSLFLAKAWLGKVLGALGTESPYPKDGTRKTVEDIEPTADTVRQDVPTPFDGTKNHIEKVDWLRQKINKVNEDYKVVWYDVHMSLDGFYYQIVTQYLSEARFWLGFELERIKRENEDS